MNYQALKDFALLAKQAPSGATVFVIVAICAYLAWAHFYGFAQADELQAVKQDIETLKDDVSTIKDNGKKARQEQLEGQMFQARVDQCKATGEIKQIFAKRLSDLEIKYIEAGGGGYRLPRCDEL